MEQLVDVLFEDDAIVVLNKQGGILTQAPPGVDSLEVRLREYLRWKHRQTGDIYVGVPHRLDRPVSGTMVFAKRRKFAHRLSKQFERREVAKTYWVIVQGRVEIEEATLTDHVRKLPGRSLAEIVSEDHPDAKHAILRYQVRTRFEGSGREATWLEVQLETGRTHQIRLQMSAHGHSVLGDDIYSSDRPFGPAFEDARGAADCVAFCFAIVRASEDSRANGLSSGRSASVARLGFRVSLLNRIKRSKLGSNMKLPTLHTRVADSHKGTFGRVLIVGGSRGMTGAVCLSGSAALRAGAGLVSVAVPDRCLETVAAYEPNYTTIPLDDEGGRLGSESLQQILQIAERIKSVGIGPGLATSDTITKIVTELYTALQIPMVVDADALNALASLVERYSECWWAENSYTSHRRISPTLW